MLSTPRTGATKTQRSARTAHIHTRNARAELWQALKASERTDAHSSLEFAATERCSKFRVVSAVLQRCTLTQTRGFFWHLQDEATCSRGGESPALWKPHICVEIDPWGVFRDIWRKGELFDWMPSRLAHEKRKSRRVKCGRAIDTNRLSLTQHQPPQLGSSTCRVDGPP